MRHSLKALPLKPPLGAELPQHVKTLLEELVAFQSVSSDSDLWEESLKCAHFLHDVLADLGANVRLFQPLPDKRPLVVARLGRDPNKKTLVVYGHYDVQPASIDDGWQSEPFVLEERDGYLYGRGATDDKGPIASTLVAVEELRSEGELPLNFIFLYEGEEESGSRGFREAVTQAKDWIGDNTPIIGVLVMDNYWLGDDRPCLSYGLRGIASMEVEVRGPKQDLHSGVLGGVVVEPMTDLMSLMARLVDNQGHVLIPGFYDDVRPLSWEEESLYEDIVFDPDALAESLGVKRLGTDKTKELLLRRWREPTLSLHGIEGAFSGKGSKTVIPSKVIGKVSMRLVPEQDPEKVADLFSQHIQQEFSKLKSPNKLVVRTLGTGEWWLGDLSNPLFRLSAEAIEDVWGLSPLYTREGGSIPIVPFMEQIFDAPVILLPVGQSSDNAHSQDERIRLLNLTNSVKVQKLFYQKLARS